MVSAREEEAVRKGEDLGSTPVETVFLSGKEVECSDVVHVIGQQRRQSRCAWSDFAVLYRQHSHRDQVAAELAEQGIPFAIENMDVMDTPEARDLFACLGGVVSSSDGASLFRIAALPQFAIDPEKLRSAVRALPKEATNSAMASVLGQMEGGIVVLERLQWARDEITQAGAKGRAALDIIVRRFELDSSSRALRAVVDFVGNWEKKPLTKTGEMAELLEYLDYFREARGIIPLPSRNENSVRLITAHSAKGLEFKHGFILRANPNSFPAAYKEPLIEFPQQLRDADSVAQGEGKTLHHEEERRLFYVAMTRARDSLTIYARQGKGRDSTPPGFVRDLLKNPGLGRWLRKRPARAFQTHLFGEACAPPAAARTSEWLSLPPASNLHAKLSATAVETYETCPLQFKLEREWRIPREVPAAIQYGAAMHRVLRAYYDALQLQRPIQDDALVELFRADLAGAGIQDQYQHELYERQGIERLRAFLSASRRAPLPEVLHTEESFEVKIGNATVVGRIDRIDKAGGNQVVITDYKTGKPQSQEDADASLQLSIYALAVREKWTYHADDLVFYNLEENGAVITQRSDLQLAEARLKVEQVAENIAAGKFDPKPGFYCSFCAYRNLCPATEKRLYTTPAANRSSNRGN